MQRHGSEAIWETLPTPEFIRGVGRGAQRCSRKVHLVGALHDGRLLGFDAPVLDEDPASPESAGVPPLYSLTQLASDNSFFDCRSGRIFLPPEGQEATWPRGTRILQCEKGSGGHWMLGVGHWDKVSRAELSRVQGLRRKHSAAGFGS